MREKVYNYFALNKVINAMEFNKAYPHLKYLEKSGLMDNIRIRYNQNGRLLGIDYRKDSNKTFQKVIIRGKGPHEFMWGTGKNATGHIKEFTEKLQKAKEMYEETASGQIESTICSEVENTFFDDDKNSRQTVLQRQQETDDLSQVVDQETERTKLELIEDVEKDMQGNRDYILTKFVWDEDIAPFKGRDYIDIIENLIDPISNMDWFHNNELLKDDDAMDEVYNRQMKFMEDNIKDIEQRIKEEEAKGDANANQEMGKSEAPRIFSGNSRFCWRYSFFRL